MFVIEQDPAITEYLKKMEGLRSKGKMAVNVGSSSSELPPPYTSPVSTLVSAATGKCCAETESRVRAEFALEFQRVKEEHAREMQRVGEEHARELQVLREKH
jgi:hypothetical protein